MGNFANLNSALKLVSVFVVIVSLLALPEISSVNGTVVSTPGTTPNTEWIGSGPFSDTLQLKYYTDTTAEYTSLCFAQANTCSSSIDLTDSPIPTALDTPPNLPDNRFYVTPESPTYNIQVVNFNLANSFLGVEFCKGADGAVGGSTCPSSTLPTSGSNYVANTGSNTVSVFQSLTPPSTSIGVGTGPTGVAINPLTGMVYVTNRGSNTVSVISSSTNTVVATINVGNSAYGVAVNPNTNTIYVTNSNDGTVSVISGSSNSVVTTITVGAAGTTLPRSIAVDPKTNIVYVANQGTNTVSVIDSTNMVKTTIAVGNQPIGIAVNPVTDMIYATNYLDDTVSVISGATNTVVTTITLASGSRSQAVTVNPFTNTIYTANSGLNTVSVISGSSNTIIATVRVGNEPLGIAADTDTNIVYVTNTVDNTVSAIDSTNTVVATITVGTQPEGIAVTINPSLIVSTCPGTTYTTCSQAGIAIRQGVAHLIDKGAYLTNVLQGHGSCKDNFLAGAQGILHSGCPGTNNPTCTNSIGAYAVDPTLPVGSQQVCPTYIPGGTYTGPACTTTAQIQGLAGSCYLPLGGACSWDILVSCSGMFQGQSQVSAFHLSGDAAATANGMVPPGSPDFCAAAQDWVNAGLGTSVSSQATGCQIIGFTGFNTGTPGTPGGPLLIYRETSMERGPLATGIGTSICQLIHGPATTRCPEVQVTTITNNQADSLVFATGCAFSVESGTTCSTQGPHRSWNIFAGTYTLGYAVNNLYRFYNSQFASDHCGGTVAGEEPNNYGLVCNTKLDQWSNYGEFDSTVNAALADTHVANEIFGNHTFAIPVYDNNNPYAYLAGWQGVSNAAGIGITHGNFYSLLNGWNSTPTLPGPTIRWGQEDQPSSLNPFMFDSEIGANIIQSVYDTLLVNNPYSPASQYSWMVNSYQIVTSAQDPNCPTTVTSPSVTLSVAGCVKLVLRGDNSWQDVYSCAPTDGACLQSHVVTAQDVKFAIANYQATSGLVTPATQNIIDVLYNPSSLPSAAFSAYGGTQSSGQPEIMYVALKTLSVWSLFDIASIPIVPQHIWKTAVATGPCLSPSLGGSSVDDIYAGTPPCTVEPTLVSGTGSDPIANGKLIGSGAWVCASGVIGASGTVIGGPQCSSSLNQFPGTGGSITLRRFQYQGTNAAQQGSLNVNFAYFRTNGKFKNFAWADYLSARGSAGVNGFGAQGVVDIRDIQSVASCLRVAPPYAIAPCNHWSSPAATITVVATAGGPNLGVVGGGRGTTVQVNIGTVSQVSRWYLTQWYDTQLSTASPPSPLLYGVNGNQLIPGSFAPPGSGQNVLIEDATVETS